MEKENIALSALKKYMQHIKNREGTYMDVYSKSDIEEDEMLKEFPPDVIFEDEEAELINSIGKSIK